MFTSLVLLTEVKVYLLPFTVLLVLSYQELISGSFTYVSELR